MVRFCEGVFGSGVFFLVEMGISCSLILCYCTHRMRKKQIDDVIKQSVANYDQLIQNTWVAMGRYYKKVLRLYPW